MQNAPSTIVFLDSVAHSFLPESDKRALADAASGDGVTQELWNEFNDRLIAAVMRTRESQRRYTATLDEEINRFTADYEKEKSLLDRALWQALASVPEDDTAGRDALWTDYGTKIKALQAKLLREVRETSTSVLREVMMTVAPAQGAHE